MPSVLSRLRGLLAPTTLDQPLRLADGGGGGGGSLLTTKGDLLSFDTAPVRVPVGADTFVPTADSTTALGWKWAAPGGGGGGGGGVPGTLADLIFWFQANLPKLSSGAFYPGLSNSCPWLPATVPTGGGVGGSRSATPLNSLGVMTLPNSGNGRYNIVSSAIFKTATAFFVAKLNGATGGDFFSGANSALQLAFNGATGKPVIIKASVAVIATAANALTVGTWYQGNVTYDDSSGAYAFRLGQAVDSSGSNAQTITAYSSALFYNAASGGEDANFDLAELILYNRVLSGPEIATIESYLNAKWGV